MGRGAVTAWRGVTIWEGPVTIWRGLDGQIGVLELIGMH